MMSHKHRPHNKEQIKIEKKKLFFCPLGYAVMWWHGLEYTECPLNPPYRDMPECKDCKFKSITKSEDRKEDWKDKSINKKKRK
jgi:hypothetical protein